MNKIVKYIVGTVSALLFTMSLASCGDGSNEEKDIAATLKLTESYANRSFISDSLGEESLVDCIDGDTIITGVGNIRFLAVDTPESTAQVEKWGKAASNFTKEKLTNAEKIVLEGEHQIGKPATTDNNDRFLAFIWYIPKGETEFRNLNLEIVQEGYSDFRQTPKYESYFREAAAQAKSLKKHVHAPKDVEDPDFTAIPVAMTLKEIKEKLASDPASILGTKVKFEAYVVREHLNKYVIRQDIDGKAYEMDLYAGPGQSVKPHNCIGNLVYYVGYVQEFKHEYQISGLVVGSTNPEGMYTKVLQQGYYLQFGTDLLTGTQAKAPHLYNDFIVGEVKTEGNVLSISGKAERRGYLENRNLTIKVTLKDGEACTFKKGDKLTFAGYTDSEVRGSTDNFTVNVSKLSDIKKVA